MNLNEEYMDITTSLDLEEDLGSMRKIYSISEIIEANVTNNCGYTDHKLSFFESRSEGGLKKALLRLEDSYVIRGFERR